ncbi:MAG: toxin-antitoxin system, antitoxin component, Xre family protein [Thermodesulfobacteriota bacterium]
MKQAAISDQEEDLIAKLRRLPPEKVVEVEDFVDFIRIRGEEAGLRQAAGRLSEETFKKVWNNPDDDAYDNL